METIPIAELTPQLPFLEHRRFRGVVTLLWPYSSSTHQCAILVADPDFRLRRKKGQVRVRFSGSSAKAVAESGVGIGDTVVLGLHGARFLRDEKSVSTPGRSIDWELEFGQRAIVQISRDGSEIADLNIDEATPPHKIQSPRPQPSAISILKERTLTPSSNQQWSSPAFLKRNRLSDGSFFEAGYDPLAQGKYEMNEQKNKRRRKSYKDWGVWTYSARTPSPEKGGIDGMDNDIYELESSPIRQALPDMPISPSKPSITQYSRATIPLDDPGELKHGQHDHETPAYPLKGDSGMSATTGEEDTASVDHLSSDGVIRDQEYYDLYAGPEELPPSTSFLDFEGDTVSNTEDDEAGAGATPVSFKKHFHFEENREATFEPPPKSYEQGDKDKPEIMALSSAEDNSSEDVEYNVQQNKSITVDHSARAKERPETEEEPNIVDNVPQIVIPPPDLPLLQTDFAAPVPALSENLTPIAKEPSSPVIKPLDSSTLPLPSPFPGERDLLATSYLDSGLGQHVDQGVPMQDPEPSNDAEYVIGSSFHSSTTSSNIPAFHESTFADVRFQFGLDGSMFSREEPPCETTAAIHTDGTAATPTVIEQSVSDTSNIAQELYPSLSALYVDALSQTDKITRGGQDATTSVITVDEDESLPVINTSFEPSQDIAMSAIFDKEFTEPFQEPVPEVIAISSDDSRTTEEGLDMVENNEERLDSREAADTMTKYRIIQDAKDNKHRQSPPYADIPREVYVKQTPPEPSPVTTQQSRTAEEALDLDDESSNPEKNQYNDVTEALQPNVDHEPTKREHYPQFSQKSGKDLRQLQKEAADQRMLSPSAETEDDSEERGKRETKVGPVDVKPNLISSPPNQTSDQDVSMLDHLSMQQDIKEIPETIKQKSSPKTEKSEEDTQVLRFDREQTPIQEDSHVPTTEASPELVIQVPEAGTKMGEFQSISVASTAPAKNTRSKTRASMASLSPVQSTAPPATPQTRSKARSTMSPVKSSYSLRSRSVNPSQTESARTSVAPSEIEQSHTVPKKQATSPLSSPLKSSFVAMDPSRFEPMEFPSDGFDPSQELGEYRPKGKFSQASFVKDSEEGSLHSDGSLTTAQYSDEYDAFGTQIMSDPAEQGARTEDPRYPELPPIPRDSEVELSQEHGSQLQHDQESQIISTPEIFSPRQAQPKGVLYPDFPHNEDSEIPSSPPGEGEQESHPSAFQQSLVNSNMPITPEPSQQVTSQQGFSVPQTEQSMPLTPQLTQKTSAPLLQEPQPEMEEVTHQPLLKATTLGKSEASVRVLSPSALSYRSASPQSEDLSASDSETTLTKDRAAHKLKHVELPSQGLTTKLSYYAALRDLRIFLNRPSSQFFGSPNPDILALVTSSTTPAKKADKGPRHYNTTLHITDLSTFPINTAVQFFRAHPKALPIAQSGDLILLRSFQVKSLNRKPMLLSGEESAWCVWRYGRPLWGVRTNTTFAEVREREEVRGPPVEISDEERAEVVKLRTWWEITVKEELEQVGKEKDDKVRLVG